MNIEEAKALVDKNKIEEAKKLVEEIKANK